MDRVGRAAIAAVSGIAVAAAVVLALADWPHPPLELPHGVIPVMAVAGAIGTLCAPRVPSRPVRAGVVLLGIATLAYALLLGAVCAWPIAHPPALLVGMAMTGHVIPLVMVQLLPLMAMHAITKAPPRWWPYVFLGANVLSLVSLLAPADAPVLRAAATVLWLGTAASVPLVAWRAVARTPGTVRRRAVLLGVAASVSPLILTACFVLGLGELASRIDMEMSLGLLMTGFSLATAATAWLTMSAFGREDSRLLDARILGRMLTGVLASIGVLVVTAATLLAAGSGTSAFDSVLIVAALCLVLGVAVSRAHRWAAGFADPRGELVSELIASASETSALQRAEAVLRRITVDAGLGLVVDDRGDPDAGTFSREPVPLTVAVRGGEAGTVVWAIPTLARTERRLRRLGDLTGPLQSVVFEWEIERERSRAASAAAAERARLHRDLHDGLQSRLLGIALNLQLEGRISEDPTTRRVIEQTVSALRSAAEEARLLADGRVPDALQQRGLKAAVDQLIGSLYPFVISDIVAARFAPTAEATGYFVVGEAVSNAIKHGHATNVRVAACSDTEGVLTVTVSDDGVGGADPRAGSGLRGLAERVASVGGVLTVREAGPHGTIVEAAIPCA